MVLALYGGLERLGLPVPHVARLADIHGPLMICGVFGTLISLERAVAIGHLWPYVAPILFALCAALLAAGAPDFAGVSAVAGAGWFLAASVWIAAQQRALFTAVLALAALMLLFGCAIWLAGSPLNAVVGWWLGFLVLTIAAERLELGRVMRPGRIAHCLFAGAVVLVVIGAVPGIAPEGGRLFGAGLFALFAWLLRHDVAIRTVRLHGQPRFMAIAMLTGYFWLAVTGAMLVAGLSGPFAYDAILHSVLIGFVLSMVLGHALIIFPAITGITLNYWPPLYLPLGFLHLSVALRILGDLGELQVLRLTSGPLTVLSLGAFAILLIAGRPRTN